MCIAIRTLVYKDGVAYLQAGGGIVFDSVPETEYFETVNKMRALQRAIDQAEIAAAERVGGDEG
jgi:anthranilate synthase component 1